MQDKLDKNILATIIYYDALNYPLTAFEVWRYLIRADYYTPEKEVTKVTIGEVVKKLQSNDLSQNIQQENGFYFLKGKKHLVGQRITSGKISIKKIAGIAVVANILKFVPFVRMVAVTGGLAMKNAQPKSDWDLLIVLEHGKIWTGRTLVTALLHILGKRRHGKKISDRACLNFFVTNESLEVITKDLFSANEYMFIFPLYGWNVFSRFQIKNQWIRKMKPSYSLTELKPPKTISDSYLSVIIRAIGELIFSSHWIEVWLKKIEKKRIMRNPKTRQEGSLIYANDDALVFLPSPHGPQIFEQFKKKANELNI